MADLHEISMRRILLTGFLPFQAEIKNPSQELLPFFAEACDTLVLPVSYQRAFEVLQKHLQATTYDFIFMLGQGGGRHKIGLERVAINLCDGEMADEDGVQLLNKKILGAGVDAYISELPLREWVEDLTGKNFPVEISNSAGTFVCNALYYRVLDVLKSQPTQALFVHLPWMLEQLAGKSAGAPGLSLQVMKETLQELLVISAKR